MALYKYSQYLTQTTANAFDNLFNPGVPTPHPGIYRCETCGHEIASVLGASLPPQNHHMHAGNLGPIRWRLIVSHT
jgi:hypothetical protein